MAAFLAAGLAGALAGAFLTPVVLTPAALAALASCAFLRAALFLCITPFLAAKSMALCASEKAVVVFLPEVRLDEKAFTLVRTERLVLLLRTAALLAIRTRFLADLIIGMKPSITQSPLFVKS